MDEHDIFAHLFDIAQHSNDKEGVVAACLVRDNEIVVACPSSDDGVFHAEYMVLQRAKAEGVPIDENTTMYITLEPCGDSEAANDGRPCAQLIINAGIATVIFAANDPEYSTQSAHQLQNAGIELIQIEHQAIVHQAKELFNSTLIRPLAQMRLPRKNKLL